MVTFMGSSVFMIMIFYMIFLILIAYVLPSFFMMGIFKKAGVPAWSAWVPFYNYWKFLQLGGYSGSLIFIVLGGVILYLLGAILMAFGYYSNGTNAIIVGVGAMFMFLFVAAVVVYEVFLCLAAYQIGKKLGKDGAFVILYIFFSVIWMGICGLDKSKWDDSKGKKSLAS